MPAQAASGFPMPNPSAGTVHSLRDKTPVLRQNFWAVALSARPRSRLPARRDGAGGVGGRHPLNSGRQQLKLSRGLPQATNLRPWKSDPARPRLCSRLGAREVPGGAIAKKREFADTNSDLGREAIPGRTRTARRPDGVCLPEGLQRKGERVALRNPRTRRSLTRPVRARAADSASFLQARPPPFLQPREAKRESREVWGEVGGASHASAVCKRREGEGEIQDIVTASTSNREQA